MILEILRKNDFTWIDVHDPHEADLERLNQEFELPFLLVQDCLRPEHLPKFEETESGSFLMLRSYDHGAPADATTVQAMTRKIALFIKEQRLVTIHRVELPFIGSVADKAAKNLHPKTFEGLVHATILAIIKTYERPITELQDVYDGFEEDVISMKKERLSMRRIYQFRRQIFLLKRLLRQSGDALTRFRNFWEQEPSMLQDLKENLDQLYFQLDEIADNFEHLFQLHIALNDQRANEVMKILTVFSSVMMPLNFIASFYGMNFTQIPGLESSSALGLVVVSMVLISLIAFWYFRRKGWFNTARE